MTQPADPSSDAAARQPRRRVLVVYNPTSGRRRTGRFARILDLLARADCTAVVEPTNAPGHATEIARQTKAADFDAIVAAGGDGTINEILNGLHPDAPALGLLPLGTANVLAREIGLPVAAEQVANAIVTGMVQRLYPGLVVEPSAAGASGATLDRRFALMIGAGFDARVVARVSPGLKRAFGQGAYVLRSATEFFHGAPACYTVTVDGTPYTAASVIVANARKYGGRFVVAREASLHRPDLEICLFQNPGRWSVIRSGLGLLTGRLHRTPGVTILRGTTIDIHGPGTARTQIDGDAAMTLPVRIRSSDTPVGIIVPA